MLVNVQAGDDAALLIGFLNTVHLPDGTDALTFSHPDQWVEDGRHDDGRSLHEMPAPATLRAGPHPPERRRSLARLLLLREGLRVLLVERGGDEVEPKPAASQAVLAEADAILRSVPLVLAIGGRSGAPELRTVGDRAGDGELAAVAAAIVRSASDGSLHRVKVCARASCRWAFFDASRNRSRAWCSMAACGNVEKNRAYRARRGDARE